MVERGREPGADGLDYVLTHRNIAAILTFGESDNLIVPPTGAGRLGPAASWTSSDFAERGRRGRPARRASIQTRRGRGLRPRRRG
ncbi:MAG: hypothetical protein MZW92_10150 [Comamonadaceae bacterium]|nr:hypothetical protein [Comamonadaceae bacterium]